MGENCRQTVSTKLYFEGRDAQTAAADDDDDDDIRQHKMSAPSADAICGRPCSRRASKASTVN